MSSDLKDLLLRSSNAMDSAPPHMQASEHPIRVAIIQPPVSEGVQSLLSHVDNDGGEGIGHKPPLGILFVASMIKARSPHEVLVIDAQASGMSVEMAVSELRAFDPHIVGISVWTDFWYPARLLASNLKQALPNTHICMGGPHVGIFPHETLKSGVADSVIVGDGEVPFLYLCNMIANKSLDNSLPGLHLSEFGVKEGGELFYIHEDLDGLPRPDRTLLPLTAYGSVLAKDTLVTTMITSRGCPHKCTFCKLNFQKNIARSAQSIIEEFREIHALGIREIEIYDDTFTWSRKRLREICEGLIAENLNVEWAVRDRVSSSSVDDDLLELMYKAGCRRIHFGIESGVQNIIDGMKKRITLQQAQNAVEMAKQAGMTVLTYFMFGNEDETVEDMKATIDFAISLNADYAQFSITIPYAGTELYLNALENGTIGYDYWKEYAENPTANFLPPKIIEEHASLDTLLEIRDEAVKRFYFRPRYVLRELFNLGSFTEFQRKARMGMQLAQSVYIK